jgi:two-component sensor histidine kinase
VEHGLAHDVANQLRSLDLGSDTADAPCSDLLRDVVADLVALFGGGGDADRVILATQIEPLHLPPYKRRALVLATLELVMNGLLHAFPRREFGRIEALRIFLRLILPTTGPTA